MAHHTCDIDDMLILASRPNPFDDAWHEWSLVACAKCRKVYEWQHHSPEQMHGGDLGITALPTDDYLEYKYGLLQGDVERLLKGSKKARCYDRYKKTYYEQDV